MQPVSLISRQEYERFIYELRAHYAAVRFSTLALVPPGLNVARVTGLLGFGNDVVLCVHEWVNFSRGLIVRYSYEVSRSPQPFASRPLPEASEYCRIGYPHK